jgi:sulfatase modifying factor 1
MKTKSVFLAAILAAVLCISGTVLAACPSMDVTGDCRVDFADFVVFAGQWLTEGTYTLHVDSSGTSGVSISSSTGHGGTTTYELALAPGTSVTLTAPATVNDTTFLSWTGDVNTSYQTISFSMDADKTVTANYVTNILWIDINEEGFNGQMSKYETTNAQYCRYLNAAKASNRITVHTDNKVYATSDTTHSQPYFFTCDSSPDSQITYSGGIFSLRTRDNYSMADHPVVMVTWWGATAFCDYYGYRLPTEGEWEAVADFNGSYTYGCGTAINQSIANYKSPNFANPLGLTSPPYTSPVGYYPAYGYGMCDMAGNLNEWTSTISDSNRVFKGGGWNSPGAHCLISRSDGTAAPSGTMFGQLGFRVCR